MLQLQKRLREQKILREEWKAKSSPKAHHLETRQWYSPDTQPKNKTLPTPPTKKKRNRDDGKPS